MFFVFVAIVVFSELYISVPFLVIANNASVCADAAYFPWLNTSVVGDRDLTGDVFVWTDNIYANRNKLSDIDPASV